MRTSHGGAPISSGRTWRSFCPTRVRCRIVRNGGCRDSAEGLLAICTTDTPTPSHHLVLPATPQCASIPTTPSPSARRRVGPSCRAACRYASVSRYVWWWFVRYVSVCGSLVACHILAHLASSPLVSFRFPSPRLGSCHIPHIFSSPLYYLARCDRRPAGLRAAAERVDPRRQAQGRRLQDDRRREVRT